MGKYRKRFNEKARSGMVAKQLALKKVRNKSFQQDDEEVQPTTTDVPLDPNAEVLLPLTTEEKMERKRQLEELLKPAETKMSSSKRKRLDKYIVSV
ncbi:Ecm16p [Sugiyamaella lignohabitans]|uniref:Ecm16p n=1 Tax=Sugiyamaella lignohabitans TaxID=796027 RepID=A0A167EKB2_9ASCO|nr:Ecm16p [Sugiyamaella lignohabitans]ANB14176.1 Ecm16p [Sugiyamaella lignohabitans]